MRWGTVNLLAPSLRLGDAASDHTFALVRLLLDEGAQPRVWCSWPPGSRLPDEIRGRVRQVHYADYPLDADLTILQYPIWFPLAERFRQVRGPALFWYHGVTPPEFADNTAGRDLLVNAQARTELAWYAQLAVTAGPYTADELHRHAGYPPDRIRVVPLGVDTAHFRRSFAAPELEQLRERRKLEGKRVLLYIGRIAANKRIDLLIDALAQLAPKIPNLHLLIVGSSAGDLAGGQLYTRLQQQAARLGVVGQVTFTGRVEDVAPYLQLADVLVLPSRHEGFGVPLVEAMAAGVPVIASAGSAMPWVLNIGSSEEAGLVFPAGDAPALAQALERVLTQPALAASLVAQGRRRAETFDSSHFRARVLAVLEEAVDLAQQGPAPFAERRIPAPAEQADIALRSYRVQSERLPAGKWVDWARINTTSHFKEHYLDRIVEQQVNFNRLAAHELAALQDEVHRLQAQLAAMTPAPSDEDPPLGRA